MLTSCPKLSRLQRAPFARHFHPGILPPRKTFRATSEEPACRYFDQLQWGPDVYTKKLLLLELERVLIYPVTHWFDGHIYMQRGVKRTARPEKVAHYYLPRPYLCVFADYILHRKTRAWLELAIATHHALKNARVMLRDTPFYLADFQDLFCQRHLYPKYQPETGSDGKRGSFVNVLQAPKNLDVVWRKFEPGTTRFRIHTYAGAMPRGYEENSRAPPVRHGPGSTLLVDRLARSGELQPFNLMLMPEYTKPIQRHDLDLHHAEQGKKFTKQERRAAKARAYELSRQKFTGYTRAVLDRTEPGSYDDALIALIGVLDHIKSVPHVARWIRSGGLMGGDLPPDMAEPEPGLQWFDIPFVYERWRARGYKAAQELGIQIRPGIADETTHALLVAERERDKINGRLENPDPGPDEDLVFSAEGWDLVSRRHRGKSPQFLKRRHRELLTIFNNAIARLDPGREKPEELEAWIRKPWADEYRDDIELGRDVLTEQSSDEYW
ncbi:hypothetical protein B0H15DRAFT_309880 [Mycena belliarum]|uniref:Uncharacterized protein n=1 Tax=Mycena belliarum TaxID=1033014 RepID=A0AAD6U1Y1_9AGAR|nr:hypothetical protein B0H15DRAFT_309880 [Mycena belliae]